MKKSPINCSTISQFAANVSCTIFVHSITLYLYLRLKLIRQLIPVRSNGQRRFKKHVIEATIYRIQKYN